MFLFDKKSLGFDKQLHILSTYAKTSQAKDALLSLEIYTDQNIIESHWKDIDLLLSMHEAYGSLPMSVAYDIKNILTLLEKEHLLTIDEAFSIYTYFKLESDLLTYKKTLENILKHNELFDSYVILDHSKTAQLFYKTYSHEGDILDDASDELYSIRKKLKSIDQRYVKSVQQALNQHQSLLNEQLIIARGSALCLAVSEAYKYQVKGITHDISQSGLTVYIEPEQSKIIRLEKETLFEEEKKAIFEILKQLTKHVTRDLLSISDNVLNMYQLDILEAKVLYTKKNVLQKPQVSQSTIDLKQTWHLELEKPVKIQVQIHYESKGLFITGPNTGGKTVTLKTVGLCQLMAQAGLFIPASAQSKVMILHSIFADIGDDQSIVSNLSTFSGHLKKHIEYLKQLKQPSLILIDEIGSGTDPQEGVALAKSILEAYISKGAFVMVTTHYQALKQFAIESQFQLASVAFNKETLAPQYHIIMGVSGQSHAFDIAKRLGMNQDILNKAYEYYKRDQSETDKLLSKLQEKAILINETSLKQQEAYIELETIKNTQEISYQAFLNEKNAIVSQSIKEAKALYEKKLETIETLIQTLKNSDLATLAMVKGTLKELKKEPQVIQSKETFVLGDHVFVSSYQQEGVVTSISKDIYYVDLGKFTLPFKSHEITRYERIKKEKNNASKQKISDKKPIQSFMYELDLRGFRFEEVKPALEQAIDKALFSNQKNLRVIHGFGTGAVRKAVYDIIKKHSHIESYRYGTEGEGLNGVTVLTFK